MRPWVAITSVMVVWLAVCPQPGLAQTRSVRVTASEAVVRLKPDPQSPAITTVKVGTLFTVSGQQGEWYEVLLPAPAESSSPRGYVLAELVEPFAGEPTVPSRLALPGVVSPPPAAALPANWQVRYDRAVERKRAGRAKARVGMPSMWAGVALTVYASIKSSKDEYDDRFSPLMGAGLGLWGGGLYFYARGWLEMGAATQELMRLETERASIQQGPLSRGSFRESGVLQTRLSVSIGPRPAAAVHMSW